MVILLLNLLISVVSEKYDEITDKKDEIQLQEWASMTCEATIHVAFWYKNQLTTDFDMVSVISELVESENIEVLGITNRIKQTLKKEVISVMATKEELKDMAERMERHFDTGFNRIIDMLKQGKAA